MLAKVAQPVGQLFQSLVQLLPPTPGLKQPKAEIGERRWRNCLRRLFFICGNLRWQIEIHDLLCEDSKCTAVDGGEQHSFVMTALF